MSHIIIIMAAVNMFVDECVSDFPCGKYCKAGLASVKTLSSKLMCHVVCPQHRIYMELAKYSMLKFVSMVKREASILICGRSRSGRIHLEPVAVPLSAFKYKCVHCRLTFLTPDAVLLHGLQIHANPESAV